MLKIFLTGNQPHVKKVLILRTGANIIVRPEKAISQILKKENAKSGKHFSSIKKIATKNMAKFKSFENKI